MPRSLASTLQGLGKIFNSRSPGVMYESGLGAAKFENGLGLNFTEHTVLRDEERFGEVRPAIIDQNERRPYYSYLLKAQTSEDQSQLHYFICDAIECGYELL